MVEFPWGKLNASLRCEQRNDRSNELDAILFGVDVVTDLGVGIVALGQPVEDVGNQLEVGLLEVLDGDQPWVAQASQHFGEVTTLSIAHSNDDLKNAVDFGVQRHPKRISTATEMKDSR